MVHFPLHVHLHHGYLRNAGVRGRNRRVVEERAVLGHWRCLGAFVRPLPRLLKVSAGIDTNFTGYVKDWRGMRNFGELVYVGNGNFVSSFPPNHAGCFFQQWGGGGGPGIFRMPFKQRLTPAGGAFFSGKLFFSPFWGESGTLLPPFPERVF